MDEPTVKRTLLIPKREYDRFRARHMGHGDFTWFVREALRCYNELNDVDPKELVALAVGEINVKDRREE